MKVIDKRVIHSITDGEYDIRLEDWSEDYPSLHAKNDQLAAYPIAKQNIYHPGYTYPRLGERFRLGMQFHSEEEAREAMQALENGSKTLIDFVDVYDATPNTSREQFSHCLQETNH